MSDVTIKTILAVALLVATTTAFLTMMALMGRAERKADPVKLRKVHKWAGTFVFALLAPLAYFGARFVHEIGDGMSTRAVFHIVLAVSLICVLVLKSLIVVRFKQFAKFAPALGMTVFVLTLVIFLITAGFTMLQPGGGR